MEVSDQFHAPVAISPGKEPRYPPDRRLGGTRRLSERGAKEKKIPAPVGNLTPAANPVA
jgi:hypothetical protein